MSTQRKLLLSFLVLGFLLALTLEHLLERLGASVGVLGFLGRPFLGIEGWSYAPLLGYAIAVATGLFCWRDARVREPANEVVEELGRVTWPTMEETRAATGAVIIASLVCAVILGLFDYGWGLITHSVYGGP